MIGWRLIVVGLALGMITGCTGQSESPPIVAPATVKPGVLVACTDMPYEPFAFQQNGEARGIDVDLLKAIADAMNLKVEFEDVDFEAIFQRLEAGGCDLVASAVSITPEREQQFAFSEGYFEVNQSLLVRATDRDRYRDLPSLSSAKIGIQKGTTGAQYAASRVPTADFTEFEDASEMVAALKRREVEAVVQDLPVNAYVSQQSPDLTVTRTFTDVERERYGFAMLKASEGLRTAVNQGLDEIRRNGDYDAILSRYLGSAQ